MLILHTVIDQEINHDRCFYSCFIELRKVSDTILCDKLWECLQCLGVPFYLEQDVKAMSTTICVKVKLNVMMEYSYCLCIGAKQG